MTVVPHTAEFRKRFSRSELDELAVFLHLVRSGEWMTMPPRYLVPDYTHCADFCDHGDLLRGDPKGKQYRNEVKGRHECGPWTGIEDYPYPLVLLDDAYKIDNREAPEAYWIVNPTRAIALRIDGNTRKHWVRKRVSASPVFKYRVPKDCCEEIALLGSGG